MSAAKHARRRCKGKTTRGKSCRKYAGADSDMCFWHADKCAVCITPMLERVATLPSCKHTFHDKCIRQWCRRFSDTDASCPLCRTPFERSDLDDEDYDPRADDASDCDVSDCDISNRESDEDDGVTPARPIPRARRRRLRSFRRRMLMRLSFFNLAGVATES